VNNTLPSRVFLDVNVVFEMMDTKAKLHNMCKLSMSVLLSKGSIIYVSPTSFAINFYLVSKALRNKQRARTILLKIYSALKFSREDYIIMEKVMQSDFEDLEDAMQYFSAQDAGVDCIITNNQIDFPRKGVPVYSIEDFFYKFLYRS